MGGLKSQNSPTATSPPHPTPTLTQPPPTRVLSNVCVCVMSAPVSLCGLEAQRKTESEMKVSGAEVMEAVLTFTPLNHGKCGQLRAS